MGKGLVDALLDKIVDSVIDDEWKGRYGEKLTARELKFANLFGKKGKILRNVYLPKDNGETSELDVIYITQKGIIVFESKNYSGWIFGDEKSKNWTMMLPNKQKNQFYNPIMQNKSHLKWLGKFVGEDIPLFSVIVFSERCELKKIAVESKDIYVIKRDQTYAVVRDIWKSNPDVLPEKQLEELHAKLIDLTNVDAATKAAHVVNIKSKYAKPDKDNSNKNDIESENSLQPHSISKEDDFDYEVADDADYEYHVEDESADSQKICPRCGSNLVLRVAKKGENAGNEFYGCSNFPKCRYIEK